MHENGQPGWRPFIACGHTTTHCDAMSPPLCRKPPTTPLGPSIAAPTRDSNACLRLPPAERIRRIDFRRQPLCAPDDARGMDDVTMRALAVQFNLSETTFVRCSRSAPMRGFASSRPVMKWPFAGHPTLGTAHVARLAGCGRRAALEFKAGVVDVSAHDDVDVHRAARRHAEDGACELSDARMATLLATEDDLLTSPICRHRRRPVAGRAQGSRRCAARSPTAPASISGRPAARPQDRLRLRVRCRASGDGGVALLLREARQRFRRPGHGVGLREPRVLFDEARPAGRVSGRTRRRRPALPVAVVGQRERRDRRAAA